MPTIHLRTVCAPQWTYLGLGGEVQVEEPSAPCEQTDTGENITLQRINP